MFTPTYNRAHTLARTYKSLVNQENKDFAWLIIDDGSTDNTRQLVKEWQERDNGFEIKYIYKENGGMHTAHNTAYENIDTELNVCIDSDDTLAPNAIDHIRDKWNEIRNDGYAGIVGLDAYLSSGDIIGKGFPGGIMETTLSGYYASGGKGDKKLVYRTEIIKKYPPYPTYEGERYFSLAYKYRMIDQDYKLAILNEILCLVDYQTDGSTNTMLHQYVNNPRGFAEWRKLCMNYPVSNTRMIMDCIHYVSSSIIAKNRNYIKDSPKKLLTVLLTPAGWALTKYILNKTK